MSATKGGRQKAVSNSNSFPDPRQDAFDWGTAELWTCVRCGYRVLTKDAAPRCAACGYRESVS